MKLFKSYFTFKKQTTKKTPQQNHH